MLSDPGPQISEWVEWPAGDRDAGSPMDLDAFFGPWRARGRYLRSRAVPGDEMSLTPATLGAAGAWQDQTPSSRFWLPPWAQRLIIVANMRINSGTSDPEGSNHAWIRARFGAPGEYSYSTEPSIFLACVVGTRNIGYPPEPESYCAGPAPDADGTVGGGIGVWYTKRMLFTVPVAMRGTEQPFIYQVKRNGSWVSDIQLRNDGVSKSHCAWYFVSLAEAV